MHGELSGTNNEYTVHTEDYQGGAVTTLVIHHAKKEDHGTYQLQAENRNGKEKIDLDLIVLEGEDDDCHMYSRGDKQCICQHSYTGYTEFLPLFTQSTKSGPFLPF